MTDRKAAGGPTRGAPTRRRRTEASAEIVVAGDLQDFVTAYPRDRPMRHGFDGQPALKDVLEALGIPHPEIGSVTVNGTPGTLRHRLRDGDVVEVRPLPPGLPIDVEEARFVVDGHLGRLAAYLRMLGFDTWYRPHADDPELATRAAVDRRILLTRDRGLLKRSVVRHGALVRSSRPREQLREVVERYGLASRARPFGRCLTCNGELEVVDGPSVADQLHPRTRRLYRDFRRCRSCGSVYWAGSHHARMADLVAEVLDGEG